MGLKGPHVEEYFTKVGYIGSKQVDYSYWFLNHGKGLTFQKIQLNAWRSRGEKQGLVFTVGTYKPKIGNGLDRSR